MEIQPRDVSIAIRVSKTDGDETGTIQTQKEYLEDYCRLHRYNIVETYIDDGVSGTIPFAERPDGQRLLRDAQRGKCGEIVIFFKVDRVGRSIKVIYDFLEELDRYGVGFIAATQPIETTTPFGKAMLGVLAVFAQLERDMTIERMYEGRKNTAKKQGHAGGQPRLGYKVVKTVVEGEADFPLLMIDFDPIPGLDFSEADLIRRIFHLYFDERLSLVALGERLDREGVPTAHWINYPRHKTAKGGQQGWSDSTLYAILTNPLYKGAKCWGVTEADPKGKAKKPRKARTPIYTHDCPHLALIEPELFDAVQALLHANQKGSSRNAKQPYLLGGALIHCAGCGYAYSGRDYGVGNGGRVYTCAGRTQWRAKKCAKCAGPILKAEQHEAAVWQQIREFCQHPQAALARLKQQLESQLTDPGALQARVDELTGMLKRLADAKLRATKLCARGFLTEEQHDKEQAELAAEEAVLKAEWEGQRAALADATYLQRRLASAEELLARMRAKVEGNPRPEQRRAVIKQAVDRIVVEEVEGVWRVRARFTFGETDDPAVTSTTICSRETNWRPALELDLALAA